MEHTLIKIDGYWIIVSNEKYSEDQWILGITPKDSQYKLLNAGKIIFNKLPEPFADQKVFRKLIASQNPAHNLPGIIFSDEVAKELGIVDVEKLADKYAERLVLDSEQKGQRWWGYQDGYNQYLEDNKEKKYTEEDVRKIIIQFATDCDNNEDLIMYDGEDKNGKRQYNDANKWVDNYIQSLNKQEYKVELEMEDCDETDCISTCSSKCQYPHPKITNNCVIIKKIIK